MQNTLTGVPFLNRIFYVHNHNHVTLTDSVSIFLGDIVGFTTLASESTAHQTVEVLNNLYNLFDSRY